MNCMDVCPVECMLAAFGSLEVTFALELSPSIKMEVSMKRLIHVFTMGSALMGRLYMGIYDPRG